MIVKLVKFRDMLTKRIEDFGGEKDPCVKAGKINICLIPEDGNLDNIEDLMIESISAGSIMSEIFINVKKRKKH